LDRHHRLLHHGLHFILGLPPETLEFQADQPVPRYYERMRTNEGWPDDRLLPLLAGVLELLPWLLQWHNALDPQYGMGLGDFFRSFVEEEARRMGKTLDEVRAWQPPVRTKGRKGERGKG
jgi:hypothetical protein